jgi:hypothetical protein
MPIGGSPGQFGRGWCLKPEPFSPGKKTRAFTQHRERAEHIFPALRNQKGEDATFLLHSRLRRDAFRQRHSYRILPLSRKADGTWLQRTFASNGIRPDHWRGQQPEDLATVRT